MNSKISDLKANFSEVQDLSSLRLEVCKHWKDFSSVQSSCAAQVVDLKKQLEDTDLSQEDMDNVMQSLQNIQHQTVEWEQKKNELDDLASQAQIVIKERNSQRTVHFHTEVRNLKSQISQCDSLLNQKQGKLEEVNSLYMSFTQDRESLQDIISNVRDRFEKQDINQPSLDGIKDLSQKTKAVESQLSSYNPQYEEMRDIARKIAMVDASKADEINAALTEMETEWENVHGILSERNQQIATISTVLQQYNEAKINVKKTLSHVLPVLEEELVFFDQTNVCRKIDEFKVMPLYRVHFHII